MPRTEDETRRLFDAWAASYDTDLRDPGGPLLGYARSITALDSALPRLPQAHVLDIGIGGGAVAERFAQQDAHITGIDISPKMLALCATRHPDYALYAGTFTAIPLPDARFDAVVSGFAFHETPPDQRPTACAELIRVLKPGGYVALLDIMFASEAARQAAQATIGDDWDGEEDYALVGELDTLLREAGFRMAYWRQTAPYHWLVTACHACH